MKHPDPEIQALMDETLAELRAGRMMPDRIEPWWEPRREDEAVTAEYLGRVLEEAGLPELAANARAGHYDDFSAPEGHADGFELVRLVRDLRRAAFARIGKPTVEGEPDRLRQWAVIENAVRRGEFDATPAESRRWAASKSGQDTFAELVGTRRTVVRTGRNDPCPCGSGVKYKRCHGAPQEGTES